MFGCSAREPNVRRRWAQIVPWLRPTDLVVRVCQSCKDILRLLVKVEARGVRHLSGCVAVKLALI